MEDSTEAKILVPGQELSDIMLITVKKLQVRHMDAEKRKLVIQAVTSLKLLGIYDLMNYLVPEYPCPS